MFATRHTHLAIGDLLDILPDAAIMVDAFGHISFVNPAVRSLLGYSPLEIVGKPLSLLVPPDVRQRHEESVKRYRADGAPTLMGSRPVLHAVHRSGKLVPVSISLCNLALEDGERVAVAVIHDVSALHTELDRATAHAETDGLTGVGNRLRLSRRLYALLASPGPFSMLQVGVADFERFTGFHGQSIGDEALRIVARRLQSGVRGGDSLARLEGNQFVMLLEGLHNPQHLLERATAVAECLCRRMHIGDVTDAVTVSIGGAMSPRHGRTERDLLDAAAHALRSATQASERYRLAE